MTPHGRNYPTEDPSSRAAETTETRALLPKRLLHDIAELQNKPYPGIALRIDDEDALQQGCLILTPGGDQPEVHLTIVFGSKYPLESPTITIQSKVSHPNVYDSYVCASILNTREGYTPAYTLRGICIQILSFFSSKSLEQEHYHFPPVDLEEYRNRAQRERAGDISDDSPYIYVCKKCSFGRQGELQPNDSVHQLTESEDQHDLPLQTSVPAGTGLVAVPTEVLYLICEHLDDEDIVLAAKAWNGFASIVRQVIRTRELRCFTLKEGFKVTTLGIGVHVEGKALQSEFELVSQLAFYSLGVRKSVIGLPFEHWLPLPLSEDHWRRVKITIDDRLNAIAVQAGIKGPPVTVIYAFMNDIVLRLSQDVSALKRPKRQEPPPPWIDVEEKPPTTLGVISERAIESYFHLFHLLLCLVNAAPEIVHGADKKITTFVEGETSKQDIPNLGHLLIMVLISDMDVTESLIKGIIKEAITRNVVWMLDACGGSMPELSFMETDDVSNYRVQKTFEASKTSYRLLMTAQLMKGTVSTMMTNSSGQRKSLAVLCKELFDRHGEPPSGAVVHLADSLRRIQEVKTFPDFLKYMGVEQAPTASESTALLRKTVHDSMDRGYSKWALTQAQAFKLRLKAEPGVGRGPGMTQEKWHQYKGFTFFPQEPKWVGKT